MRQTHLACNDEADTLRMAMSTFGGCEYILYILVIPYCPTEYIQQPTVALPHQRLADTARACCRSVSISGHNSTSSMRLLAFKCATLTPTH